MTNLWVHAGSLFLLLLLQQTEISEARSYNNGLIFYDLRTRTPYLPPTVSVSRGRNLASVKYSEKGSIWSTFGQPCDCRGPTCGCCAGLKVDQYKFDQKMCANITFVPQLEEAQLEVFMNGRPSSKYGISVRNPSPFCIPVMMGVPMAMCVQMTDIAMVGNNLNMCMDFVVRLATTDLFEMHFQCMRMGLDGIQYVDKNGQPVLPSSAKEEEVAQEEEEEEDYFAPDTNEGAVEYDYAGEAEAELQQEKEQQGLEPTDKLLVVVQDTVSEEEEEQQQQQQQQQQLDSVVAAYVPQPLPIESEMLMAVDNELAGEPLSEDSDMDNHSGSESDLKQNEVIETITNSIEAATTAATTTTTPAAATKLEAVAPSDNNDVADADVAALTAEIDENVSDNEVNIDNDEQQEEVAEDGEEKEEKEEEEGEK
ncbi:uncharacterized protein LOC115627939, partial [Scaptodrosophila lebanonensis]|uniref:Uncharacterized protein LOC115627939 n=1 Tax=Drosophila lebanonensis TaxID=7225 RepID=A0A6J2TSY6_DROLE